MMLELKQFCHMFEFAFKFRISIGDNQMGYTIAKEYFVSCLGEGLGIFLGYGLWHRITIKAVLPSNPSMSPGCHKSACTVNIGASMGKEYNNSDKGLATPSQNIHVAQLEICFFSQEYMAGQVYRSLILCSV
jgi:hypothetical protein